MTFRSNCTLNPLQVRAGNRPGGFAANIPGLQHVVLSCKYTTAAHHITGTVPAKRASTHHNKDCTEALPAEAVKPCKKIVIA